MPESTEKELHNSEYRLAPNYIVSGDLIKNIQTGDCAKDVPVDDLPLTNRAINKLKREGYFYLSNLVGLSESQLALIPKLGYGTLLEIKKAVTKYLNIEPDVVMTSEQDNGSDTRDVTSQDSLSVDAPSPVSATIRLVSGYSLTMDNIVNNDTGEVIEDISITALSLGTRAINILKRNNVKKLSDLMMMSPVTLYSLPGWGENTTNEAEKALSEYLTGRANEAPNVQISDTLSPNFGVVDGVITNIENGKIVKDVPIEQLLLGNRAQNCLKRNNVTSLSDLVTLSVRDLTEFPNMGIKSIYDIENRLNAYLVANSAEHKSIEESIADDITEQANVLPELPEDTEVIAPEYAVIESDEQSPLRKTIVHRDTMRILSDAPIDILSLGIRAMHGLQDLRISFVSELVNLSLDTLRSAYGIGETTVIEILDRVDAYLRAELNGALLKAETSIAAKDVLQIFKGREFSIVEYSEIAVCLPEATPAKLMEVLDALENEGVIERYEDGYKLINRSYYDHVSELLLRAAGSADEVKYQVLLDRAHGYTLDEVGKKLNLSRERIRQMEHVAYDKSRKGERRIFAEDRYAYLYANYNLEKDFFINRLQGTFAEWYYLSLAYKGKKAGRRDIYSALDDPMLDNEGRLLLEEVLTPKGTPHDNMIEIDGEWILRTRSAIEEYVVEHYCKDEVTAEEFFNLYDRFVKERNITDPKLTFAQYNKSGRLNRLSESRILLWKQNQRLRYYNIDGIDDTELLKTLDLYQYYNIEISTRKFMIAYPELMRRYDIRDEYELHNLLRKIQFKIEAHDLTFRKMPNIQFGEFDRDAEIKDIVFEKAPISSDDLVDIIEREFGYKPETVRSSMLSCVSQYCHNRMYTVDHIEMPASLQSELRMVLTDDFYFFSEIKEITRRLTKLDVDNLITAYSLKKMGYLVGSTYVLTNPNYKSAEAYFDSLLLGKDTVDATDYVKRFGKLSTFTVRLTALKHALRIIEFDQYQYISIQRLEKMGYGMPVLTQFCDQVASFLQTDNYFTVQSLREDGFSASLFDLGFDDLFYASILKEDSRFSWQKIGHAVVFNPKKLGFSAGDFICEIVNEFQAVDLDDFVYHLNSRFGLGYDRYTVPERIKGTRVYYDSIMGKLYKDYETYYKEI